MTKASAIARVIRAELIKEVDDSAVGVALSGGVDSVSVLAALLLKGVRPKIISYTPSTHESTDFKMARKIAADLDLEFHPSIVDMDDHATLEKVMRLIIARGFKTKLEVECLIPMMYVGRTAFSLGLERLYTGDQSDGYFINNNWMARNFDRAQGIPGYLRTAVSEDDDPWRIDRLRDIYYDEDRSCSNALTRLWREMFTVDAVVPYRSPAIREAFRGSLWTEVNQPRMKEPIRLAFPEMPDTRPKPVNLHRGDSYFAERFGKMIMERLPGDYRTTTGLYSAIARGQR